MVKVHNDIVAAIDQGRVGALAMLDLSSAFDTVDHQILLSILQQRFAVTDSALDWFSSYLTNQSCSVHLESDVSEAITVNCGIPQGSSLGPKIFIAYTEELDEVFDQHQVHHHCFADDTQAYVDDPRPHAATVATQLQNCIVDVANWCGARRLQLNPSKTEVM